MFLDIFFLVVIGVFAMLAAVQGFLNGVVSLVVLIVSVIISYYFSHFLIPKIDNLIGWHSVSSFLGYSITFLVAYLVLGKIGKLFMGSVYINKGADFLLGMLLGIFKGGVICTVILLVLEDVFYNDDSFPDYLTTSQIRLIIHHILSLLSY